MYLFGMVQYLSSCSWLYKLMEGSLDKNLVEINSYWDNNFSLL